MKALARFRATETDPSSRTVFVIEDDSARASRRPHMGVREAGGYENITVSLHRMGPTGPRLVASDTYASGELKVSARDGGKGRLALRLLERHVDDLTSALVVAGPHYGHNGVFLDGLLKLQVPFAVELRPSAVVDLLDRKGRRCVVRDLVVHARLRVAHVEHPLSGDQARFGLAALGRVSYRGRAPSSLIVAQAGAIPGIHRGTVIALGWPDELPSESLLRAIWWARLIRPAVRRTERRARGDETRTKVVPVNSRPAGGLDVRANIALAQEHDRAAGNSQRVASEARLRGVLGAGSRTVNVAELFAGAGGMGLGFLLADGGARYRLAYSGEVHPIYVNTLKSNHAELRRILPDGEMFVPAVTRPVDLRSAGTLKQMQEEVAAVGGVDVLIGGPPCQGFSMSNRNSGWSRNPNNALVNVFVHYVEAVRPAVFLMENVQGILWASNNDSNRRVGVVEHLARRFARAGYSVFPKLLDSVWYGVPQFRSRFFLLGMRGDLGYHREDFGDWGPFPHPSHGPGRSSSYVSVADAIMDLPKIGNGRSEDEMPYDAAHRKGVDHNAFLSQMRQGATRGLITDHVTSRHSDYVLDRYRRIPPGGNWSSIRESFTNYSDVDRTHSNIYRRLALRIPSVTIGHYRKAMLIHPTQTRGLSLREASRLQSFPDWFRFSGSPGARMGGLVHKQQQLANAVCPLVSKAIAEFILQL